jgi:hypothetical protein
MFECSNNENGKHRTTERLMYDVKRVAIVCCIDVLVDVKTLLCGNEMVVIHDD